MFPPWEYVKKESGGNAMSAKTEKLLVQYRVYENLVRNSGADPRAVEDTMDES